MKCPTLKPKPQRRKRSVTSRRSWSRSPTTSLFGDIWERAELSKRDRSLVTVAALITNGSTEQLKSHLARAKDNGLSEAELKEVIIHLAFYAGWPRAMSAVTVAKEIFAT